MHILSIFLTVVEVIVCLLLIGIVLIQRSKGEGLNAAIGGGMGEAIFGANVGNVVTRTTVVLGMVFLVNTIILAILLSSGRGGGSSIMEGAATPPPASAPVAAPGLPPQQPLAPAAPVAPATPAPAPSK